jgi:hypothetical protein
LLPSDRTRSTRCAAVSAMRRPPQLGQKPRRLHEKGRRRSQPQSSQCRRKGTSGACECGRARRSEGRRAAPAR